MDPRNGTLSRAMRNRSVEIYFNKENFWDNSIELFFNYPKLPEEQVEESSLSWIISTSIDESIKQKALEFSVNLLEDTGMYSLTKK